MNNLSLTLDVFAGSGIPETCVELQALADRLGIVAMAKMNGVVCMACPGGDAGVLSRRQQEKQGDSAPYKIVSSRV